MTSNHIWSSNLSTVHEAWTDALCLETENQLILLQGCLYSCQKMDYIMYYSYHKEIAQHHLNEILVYKSCLIQSMIQVVSIITGWIVDWFAGLG